MTARPFSADRAAAPKPPFSLSAPQHEALGAAITAWRRIGNASRRIDRRRAKAAIFALYRALGEERPALVWFGSPVEAADALGGVMTGDVPQHIDSLAEKSGLPSGIRPRGFGARLASKLANGLRKGVARALSQLYTGNLDAELRVLGAVGSLRPSAQPLAVLESQMNMHGELVVSSDELGTASGSPEFRDGFWGQELGSLCAYEFCRDCLGAALEPAVSQLLAAAIHAANVCAEYWPYRGLCVLAERALTVRVDEQQRLHHASLPALEYPNGERHFAWRGTVVPPELIQEPSRFDLGFAMRWSNVEVRRAALEIFGSDLVLSRLGARVVDRHADPAIGTLFETNLRASDAPRLLCVRCATGRQFLLCVPPTMQTALEANAWTYGLEANDYALEVRT